MTGAVSRRGERAGGAGTGLRRMYAHGAAINAITQSAIRSFLYSFIPVSFPSFFPVLSYQTPLHLSMRVSRAVGAGGYLVSVFFAYRLWRSMKKGK